jgi:molybdenum cofactor cytidylyltransferase
MRAEGDLSEAPIIATAYDGRGGVPALFVREFFPALRSLSPKEGARALLVREAARTRLLQPAEPFFDLDTPENYRLYAPQAACRAIPDRPMP